MTGRGSSSSRAAARDRLRREVQPDTRSRSRPAGTRATRRRASAASLGASDATYAGIGRILSPSKSKTPEPFRAGGSNYRRSGFAPAESVGRATSALPGCLPPPPVPDAKPSVVIAEGSSRRPARVSRERRRLGVAAVEDEAEARGSDPESSSGRPNSISMPALSETSCRSTGGQTRDAGRRALQAIFPAEARRLEARIRTCRDELAIDGSPSAARCDGGDGRRKDRHRRYTAARRLPRAGIPSAGRARRSA